LTDDLDGPMNFVFDFASYLLPLAILELQRWARARDGKISKGIATGVLVALTLYMLLGIFALTASDLRRHLL
jgi:hypothetical protein